LEKLEMKKTLVALAALASFCIRTINRDH